MYERFYHLSTDAFRLTPDARFCYFHDGQARAHAYMEYALKVGDGFVLVTGRPGTGKTTLIDAFISRLERGSTLVRSITASGLESTELLRAVAYAYGIQSDAPDTVSLRQSIQQHFLHHLRLGKHGLLIVDEAQGLSPAAIEELRLLSDLRCGANPLLQLFLVGQDSLQELMCSPELEQFQQRVAGTCRLEPLDLKDTRNYVRHRLVCAGWKGDPQFTGEAIAAIHRQSAGIPRHINKICSRLLLMGCMEGRHDFEAADVLTIAAELNQERLGPRAFNGMVPDEEVQFPGAAENNASRFAELGLRADRERSAGNREPVRAAMQHLPPPAVRADPTPVYTHRSRGRSHVSLSRYIPKVTAVLNRMRKELHVLLDSGRNFLQGIPAERFGMPVMVVLSLIVLIAWFRDGEDDPEAGSALVSANQQMPKADYSLGLVDLPSMKEPLPIPESPFDAPHAVASQWFEAAAFDIAATDVMEPSPLSGSRKAPTVVDAAAGAEPVSPPPAPAGSVSPVQETEPAAVSAVTAANEEAMEAMATVSVADVTEPAPPDVAESGSPSPAEMMQRRIDVLLVRGLQALEENRLLIPADDNAHRHFRKVLALDPGNAAARDGIEQIVRRYLGFAKRALERKDEVKTRRYIDRGLLVRPDDERLLALQGRLTTWLARVEEEAVQVVPAKSPLPALPPEPQPADTAPEGFFSRVKAFFSQVRNQDQGGDIRE